MFKMYKMIKKGFQAIPLCVNVLKIRHVSVLYITGDKASENCVVLQPYMDFEKTFQNIEQLEYSIEKRKLSIDLKRILEMYTTYRSRIEAMDKVNEKRQMITNQLKELTKATQKDESLINQLKEKGKQLKNDLKTLKTTFYPIEDEFVQSFLNLPNTLHKQCPVGDHEKLLYRSQQKPQETEKSHLEHENLIHFIGNSRYYMLNEAAMFDIKVPFAFARYFLEKGNFIQSANPDFTRLVLLEAKATPLNHYHKVMEENLQNNLNASYLTGGGSFESFLGSVTKLCVYPKVLPLKYVSNGRLYEITNTNYEPSLFTATQNNAVQTFVATTSLAEAEEQMENILNLCLDFYKLFNIHFRIIYINAAKLTPSESLRAQIEVYSPHEKRYVCVGHVSNYKDFVSKRVLFTMRQEKNYHFLHLVGGPVLYTSRLIAALIEHGETLDYEHIFKSLNLKNATGSPSTSAVDEFKSLF